MDNRVYSYSFDYIIRSNVDVNKVEQIILNALNSINEIEVVGNPGINNTSWSKEEYGISSSNDDYGFHWDGSYVFDKDGNWWYFGDYSSDGLIEPYSTYDEAVNTLASHVRDSYTEEEIPDPYNYTKSLIDFVIKTMDGPGKFIRESKLPVKSSRKPIKSSHNGEDICGNCSKESNILVEDLKEALGREGHNMDMVNEFFNDNELDDYDSLCYDCASKLRKEFEKWSTNKSAAFSSRKAIKSSKNKAWCDRVAGELHSWYVCYIENGEKKYQYGFKNERECIDWIKSNGFILDEPMEIYDGQWAYNDDFDDDDVMEGEDRWDDDYEIDSACHGKAKKKIKSSANRNRNNLNSIFNG